MFSTRWTTWGRPLALGGGIGVIFAVAFASGWLSMWSERLNDRLFIARPADPRILIVAIDDASLGQIGRWPWPRSVEAELLDKISSAKPLAIGLDVNFPEVSTAEDDQALAEAIQLAGNVVLPVEVQISKTSSASTFDPRMIVTPLSMFTSVAASIGHSNTPPDADGVVRRVPILVQSTENQANIPAFSVELARVASIQAAQPAWDQWQQLRVWFLNQPGKSFQTISAADILKGRVDPKIFVGKLVLIGATAADLHDALLVPTSNGQLMSGVEIHASLLDTILQEKRLQKVPWWGMGLFLFCLAILVAAFVTTLRLRWILLVLAAGWLAYVALTFWLFDRGWIMEILWPTITLVVTMIVVGLERRLASDQQRRQLREAFSRYVSPSVVTSILNNPDKLKLGGERRRMTVMFSDLRGFTTLSEGLDPQTLVQLLNRYLTRMTEAVFLHDGVLDKYIGDAVMAFWGAPFVQPDHATRAVRTALEMKQALEEMNQSQIFGSIQLKMGIGITTGDMVVGNVGGEKRFDYTVIGDQVNLASRLEGLTKAYGVTIIISESVKQELGSDICVRRLDRVAVKGKKDPVQIYEVIGNTSSCTSEVLKLVEGYESALEKYEQRDFAGCLATCQALSEQSQADPAMKILCERAEKYLASPPPADWDGTWVYTTK